MKSPRNRSQKCRSDRRRTPGRSGKCRSDGGSTSWRSGKCRSEGGCTSWRTGKCHSDGGSTSWRSGKWRNDGGSASWRTGKCRSDGGSAIPDRRPAAHVHSSQGEVISESPAHAGTMRSDSLPTLTPRGHGGSESTTSWGGDPHHGRAFLLKYRQPRYPSKITNNPTKPASHEMRF
jgi:hypothetical protein